MTDRLIAKRNPSIRGWENYFRPFFSRKTFKSRNAYLYLRCIRSGVRRHPQKGKKRIVNKEFSVKKPNHPMGSKNFVFVTPNGFNFWVRLRKLREINLHVLQMDHAAAVMVVQILHKLNNQ